MNAPSLPIARTLAGRKRLALNFLPKIESNVSRVSVFFFSLSFSLLLSAICILFPHSEQKQEEERVVADRVDRSFFISLFFGDFE